MMPRWRVPGSEAHRREMRAQRALDRYGLDQAHDASMPGAGTGCEFVPAVTTSNAFLEYRDTFTTLTTPTNSNDEATLTQHREQEHRDVGSDDRRQPDGTERNVPAVTTEWPRTDDGRLICTPDRPMPDDARREFGGSARWQHSDVEDIGECAEGCCDRMRCKSCGVRWIASYGR